MPRYLVERTFADGMNLNANEEGAVVCEAIVLNNTEHNVTWIQSYVSTDCRKMFCVYEAPSPEAIRRTAQRNNLPLDRITKVRVFDPYFHYRRVNT